jgi:hypothetical protein
MYFNAIQMYVYIYLRKKYIEMGLHLIWCFTYNMMLDTVYCNWFQLLNKQINKIMWQQQINKIMWQSQLICTWCLLLGDLHSNFYYLWGSPYWCLLFTVCLSSQPECVLSFNMDWQILVNFIPRFTNPC